MSLSADPSRKPDPGPPRRTGDSYSRWVRQMKIALPLLAGLLLLILVVWPQLGGMDGRFALSFASLRREQVEALSMLNARYFGVDRRNRPFTVVAASAAEQKNARDMVDLDQPKADFVTGGGAQVSLSASHGLYYQGERILDLTEGVVIRHQDGYVLKTSAARVDLDTSAAWGSDPVEGEGPKGRIKAQGFTIPAGAKDVIFTGQAWLTVKGAKAR